MKKLPFALLFAASLASADGTHAVTSMTGKCSLSVPAAFKGEKSVATSPDKKVSVSVTQPKIIDSFDQLKTTAKGIYKDAKVTKDGAAEFEMEGKSMNDKPNVYRAIAFGDKQFCIAEVVYESGTADDARKIARSLAGSK
jgi:hypothetical protein